MKLAVLLLITVMMHLCHPAFSQKVSIDAHELPLEELLKEISRQTNLEFFYQSTLLKNTKPVTLHVRQSPVEKVLKRCLEDAGFDFTVRVNTIVIFRPDAPADNSNLSGASHLMLTGHIIDANGLSVETASVVLLRTQSGTLTDRSGAFTLKVKERFRNDTLIVSHIGLKTSRIALGNRNDVDDIVMQPADNTLDEVITVAYGTTSDRYRTGDITTVRSTQIEKTTGLNVIGALAGRVAGLYVRQNGSNPGNIFNFQLRGVNVLPSTTGMTRGNAVDVLSKPLIVLDGLPLPPDVLGDTGQYLGMDAMTGMVGAAGGQDPLYFLNPLDVESITVLKDAEATALYGSRAANGVIIITTKKARAGKTAMSITFNTGINALARRVKLMNTEQYLAMRNEAVDNFIRYQSSQNNTVIRDSLNLPDLQLLDATRSVDWQDALLGSAPVYNTGIALSGGEDRTSYRLSAGYNVFNSSYPHLKGKSSFKDEKGTLLISLSSRSSNNRLKIHAAVSASGTASYQPATNPDKNIFLLPNAPAIFNSAGTLDFVAWRPLYQHSLSMLAEPYKSNRFTTLSRLHLAYEVFRPLTLTLEAGYLRSDGKQVTNHPAASVDTDADTYSRWALFGNSKSTGFNVEPSLRYNIQSGRHTIDAMTGASYQSDSQQGQTIMAAGYQSDDQMGSIAGSTYSSEATGNMIKRRAVSALARISYRYADKWLLNISGRRDGSSSFGPARRFGNFGSLGWGWIFTREAWPEKTSLLSWGKIRGSYGITGSQNAIPYAYLSSFGPRSGDVIYYPGSPYTTNLGSNYGGWTTIRLVRSSNTSLGWAQAAVLEFGLDLYFFKDQQLKIGMQWYRKRTANQLVNHQVSAVTGSMTTLVNLPAKVQNTGFETVLDYAPVPSRVRGVRWDVQFNIAVNRNKLVAYPGLEGSPFSTLYEIGKSISRQDIYYTFVNQSLGYYSKVDSLHTTPIVRKVNRQPIVTGGMQASISWRQLSLSVSCTFAKQKGFINVQGATYPGVLPVFGLGNQPVSAIHEQRWHGPADAGLTNAFHIVEFNDEALDIYWGNASYIAVKNVSLTYNWPDRILRKLGVNQLNSFVKAENLILVSLAHYQGMNPEQPNLLNQQMPLRRIVVGGFGISL